MIFSIYYISTDPVNTKHSFSSKYPFYKHPDRKLSGHQRGSKSLNKIICLSHLTIILIECRTRRGNLVIFEQLAWKNHLFMEASEPK